MFFKAGMPESPLGVLFCYWACIWLGWSLGLALCAVERIFPLFMNFFSMVIRFGMWVSGVVFMADRMPESVLVYLRWNPILHCRGRRAGVVEFRLSVSGLRSGLHHPLRLHIDDRGSRV